jgi:hypothetical protein
MDARFKVPVWSQHIMSLFKLFAFAEVAAHIVSNPGANCGLVDANPVVREAKSVTGMAMSRK